MLSSQTSSSPNLPPQPVILFARPAAGGIRSHLISLLSKLDRSKFDITLAAPNSLLSTLPDNLPPYSEVQLPITSKPTPFDFLAAYQIAQLARSHPTAIFHAHGVRAGFVCSLARQFHSFKLVVTHHNIPPSGPLSRAILELIDFGCAATVAVSNAIAANIPGTDTTVIPNGIDIDSYRQVTRTEAKSQIGILDQRFVAAYLGRLSKEKGADLIIRAALLRPDITFLIGGDGPERERLIRNCPINVTMLGRVPNPATLLSAADIMIIPSRAEGQGIVALEAMASGAPVIASRVGGLIETLEQSGGGILVDPESPIQIANAIDKLRNDPELRQSLADAGTAWVKENGRLDTKIETIEGIYERLCDRTIC